MRQRFGIGYDSHVFGANKKRFILGGVEIENETGLKGHSDCDAVAHAIIDALLGAVAMGDIGQMFPDTDKRWKDADSIMMLSEVRHRLVAASYNIVNVDATIVIEKPRMAPYINGMRENIARALGIAVNAVSVKAKTNEKMDSVGRGKGIQVFAIASVGGA
jgi:2-C-methyl-D-erythritol 2,4-cyclodiphosphate synthase